MRSCQGMGFVVSFFNGKSFFMVFWVILWLHIEREVYLHNCSTTIFSLFFKIFVLLY